MTVDTNKIKLAFDLSNNALKCLKNNCKKDVKLVAKIHNTIYIRKKALLQQLKTKNITLNDYKIKLQELYYEQHLSKLKINEYNCELQYCTNDYKKLLDFTLENILNRKDLIKTTYTTNNIIEITKITLNNTIDNEIFILNNNERMIYIMIELNEKLIPKNKNKNKE